MTDWPLASDYVGMVQDPKIAFKDPGLRQCTIKRDQQNLPVKMAGSFAVVFQATLPDGTKRAVRAFTTRREGITKRYRRISRHVLQKTADVEALVSFEYQEEGIRAILNGRSGWYPLIVMEWAPGITLYEWVRERCLHGDGSRLRKAADQWSGLIDDLARAEIAHGDLQHANVLVDGQDRFRLVDYDGMCVPGLVGEENIEVGLPPYQHPDREQTCLSLSLDDFSAIFIYVALRALAAAPELWAEFVEETKYEKLLFQQKDFKDFKKGSQSELYRRLQHSPDADVVPLTERLFKLYCGPLKCVPPLKELLFSYDKIRILLDAKKFDEAVEALDRKKDTSDAPDDLKPRIQDAYRRVERLRQLRAAGQAGDERGMQRLYDPKLLDDYPAARPYVAEAKLAGRVLSLFDQLDKARQRARRGEFLKIWDADRGLLETRKSAQSYRTQADQWRRERQDAWKGFQTALQQCIREARSEQLDRQLVPNWNEDLLAGWDVAERERPQLTSAQKRLQTVAEVNRLIQQSPTSPTRQSEQRIVQAAAGLPAGYDCTCRDGVQTADRRLKAARQVTQEAQRQNDLELAERWRELSSLQGQAMVDAPTQQRARLAGQRAVAWSGFRSALDRATASPGEQTDAALDKAWNESESLFRGWPLAEQSLPRVEEARRRLDVLKQLDQLLRRTVAVTLAGERNLQRLAGRLPPVYEHRHRARTDLAEQRLQAAQQLPELIRSSTAEEQIRDAWQRVQRLEATSLVDAPSANRGKLADERLRVWAQAEKVLEQLKKRLSETHEAELLRLWKDNLFKGWRRAEDQRPQVVQARQHQATLRKLRDADSRPLTVQGEDSIVQLTSGLPRDYDYALRQRVDLARGRTAAVQRLTEAVRGDMPERTIVEAAGELDRLQATALIDARAAPRVHVARQRLPVLQQLESIPAALPRDRYDEQVLRIWQDVLRNCLQAKKEGWLAKHENACARKTLIQRLARAIARKDDEKIGVIVCDRLLDDYPFPDKWTTLIDEVRGLTRGARRLLDALQNNQRSAFFRAFDAKTIRRCHYMFTGVRQQLVAWTREEILPLERLRLRAAQGRDSVRQLGKSMYRLRWTWPERRLVERCLVAISSRPLNGQCDPRNDGAVVREWEIDREAFDKEGCTVFWDGRRGGLVYACALVDLGFQSLTSPPLELGQVQPAREATDGRNRRGGEHDEPSW